MPERVGQLLRQALQRRFEGAGSGEAKKYEMTGGYWIAAEGIAVQSDSTASRLRKRATPTGPWWRRIRWTRLTSGFARTAMLEHLRYAIFRRGPGERGLQKRIAEALADQITMKSRSTSQTRRGGRLRQMKLSPQRSGASCATPVRAGSCCCMARTMEWCAIALGSGRTVAGSLDDPFLVTGLKRRGVRAPVDEAATLPLTGGRRVVRLRDAGDTATAAVTAILKGAAPALIVLEARECRHARGCGRWWRRAQCHGNRLLSRGGARARGDDPGRHERGGRGHRRRRQAWLSAHLGADRASTRQEFEKLALYVGEAAG